MDDINEELRETIPFDQLAARFGASREEVEQATEMALPALLQGMNANAHRSPSEAESLLGALIKDHDGSVIDADDVIDRVDPEYHRRIVGHVFGDQADGDGVALEEARRSLWPAGRKLRPPLAVPVTFSEECSAAGHGRRRRTR